MVGKTLGHYKILEPLGAGGMGEVYLGEDTRLGRKVAIKVLPEEYASDPERLARFEQEARAAAALNHPHIAVVHDVGSESGDDGSITHFMVQEYLEGQSLRERLEKGALPLDKALDLAIEVGEALTAAHKAGIVHRDLKPDNIFVTEEGHAKVLDFGLAKLTEMAAPTGTSASMSPTMLGTVAGQVMGTAGYMAPEQINGEEIDNRADLFAFGAVFYEMVTGRRAFAGDNIHETLSRIISKQPQAVHEIRDDLPLKLGWIIDKALAKDVNRRYQSATGFSGDLLQLQDDIAAGVAVPVSEGQAVVAPAAVATARGIPWKLAVPIAVAIALLGALAVWITIPSPPESLIRRFHIDYPPETTFEATATLGVAISPDGRSVVFNANRQLWLRAIDDPVATPIRGTEQARVPFFSSDGQQLGFWGGDGQIKSVSITGGAPVSLGTAPDRAFGASWADDGYIYFGQGSGGILRVSETGGEPETVVEVEEGEQAHGPQLLPGGEWLLFTLRSGSGSWDDASIMAQPVSGGDRKLLVAGGTDGRYVPTGHIVYSQQGDLFAAPFDADTVEVTGGSVSIVLGVQQATGITGAGQYAFSDRGGLVYIPGGGARADFQLVWMDREGRPESLPFEPNDSRYLDLSPNDQRVALDVVGDEGTRDIWIYEVERAGSQVKLTSGGNNVAPVWSPDGAWVYFASDRDGNRDIWRQRADQSGDAEKVLDTEVQLVPSSISSDGQMLLFNVGTFPNQDLGILDLDTGESQVFEEPGTDEAGGIFSPDGRFFAFQSNRTGQQEVVVQELSSGSRSSVSTSIEGGRVPRWGTDGQEIYYVGASNRGLFVVQWDADALQASDPVQVSDIAMRGAGGNRFDVTADGQRFLVSVPAGRGDPEDAAPTPRINVILNWFEELKQRVPTGR